MVNALLVCQDFRDLIQANPLLVEAPPPPPPSMHNKKTKNNNEITTVQVLTLPRFDEIDSRQVVLGGDGRHARCTSSTNIFPSYQYNTAFVRTRPTAPGHPPLAVVHFLVDFVPSNAHSLGPLLTNPTNSS